MKSRNLRRQAGFSLVEVALALGVAAFCILPVVGLLDIGYNANRASIRQTAAASIAAAISTDLKATPASAVSSPYFGLPIPASGAMPATTNLYVQDDGTVLPALSSARPTFLATVVITPAISATALGAGYARILITWPALAKQVQSPGVVPTQYDGSLETTIGLNAN